MRSDLLKIDTSTRVNINYFVISLRPIFLMTKLRTFMNINLPSIFLFSKFSSINAFFAIKTAIIHSFTTYNHPPSPLELDIFLKIDQNHLKPSTIVEIKILSVV